MKRQLFSFATLVTCWLSVTSVAQAQIGVTEARIGCLDVQKDGNLTSLVATACNGKPACSYKAPTPQEYLRVGVHAATRTFCTQAMEITYRCGNGQARTAFVPGDAWSHAPAELICEHAASPVSSSQPHTCSPGGANHFYVVTLGDSVMWGQGLPNGDRFRDRVTTWLQSQLGAARQVCQVPTRSHSGARIAVDAANAQRETGLSGEIPSAWPSISYQVDLTVRDLNQAQIDPKDVGLVLLDGGINDVSVESILDPINSSGKIEQWTNQVMARMDGSDGLLQKMLHIFPRAGVVVTGYFQIASNDSDVTALLALTGAVLGSKAGKPGLIGGGVLGAASKPQLVKNSKAFVDTIHQRLVEIINRLPPTERARTALAVPNFQSINAYGARGSFLWRLEEFMGPEADGVANIRRLSPDTPNGVAWNRARACTASDRPSAFCIDASMGHPNLKGSEAYTNAIVNVIRNALSAQLGLLGPVGQR